jgi:protease I
MPHAVIITGPGFQDHDVIYTYYRLKEALFDVDIATATDVATGNGIRVTGRCGVPVPLDRNASEPIAFSALGAPDAAETYDLIVLTGGYEAPDRVRQDDDVKAFLRAMDDAGKVIAGLCHGPWIMISAGIMRGRRACAYVGMRDDMVNAGANVVDADVVVDHNIVTCSYYGEVGAFMKIVIALVEERMPTGHTPARAQPQEVARRRDRVQSPPSVPDRSNALRRVAALVRDVGR